MKVPAHQISLQAKQAHEADPPARFILLRLPHGTARFWSITDTMREKDVKAITF